MAFTMTNIVGAEFPLFAFSHCRDVVAAVTRAGGFGVLGGSSFTPQQLEEALSWIDRQVDGKPYGIDILIPEHQSVGSQVSSEEIMAMIPSAHRDFLATLLREHGIDAKPDALKAARKPGTLFGEELLEVAFRHPIRLVANALGIAPQMMIDKAREAGVPVAAMVGAKEHALRQVEAGVDIVIAQGTEAGGHCGEVSTLVLVPEVIRAVREVRDVPVLAAGGIMTGEQMAGLMAMGAAGVWTGSVWLATTEAETSEVFREKMVSATSRETIRSKYRTGKPSRQLRSHWHEAWEGQGAPAALPMPVMSVLTEPAMKVIDRAAENGDPKARELVTYFVGQGVGLVEGVRPAGAVVQSFKEEFASASERFLGLVS